MIVSAGESELSYKLQIFDAKTANLIQNVVEINSDDNTYIKLIDLPGRAGDRERVRCTNVAINPELCVAIVTP